MFCASAQTTPSWQWAKSDTNIKVNILPGYARSVIAATRTKVFWSVLLNSKIALNPASYGDYKVAEYDSMGNATAVTDTFKGKMYFKDVQADAAGNWYILGVYYDTMQYHNFFSAITQFNSPDQFILRLDAGTLNMSWFKFLGVNYYSRAECFTIKNNYLYIPIDSSLITTVYKINLSDGSRAAVLSQKAGRVTSIAVDSSNNVYIAGNCAQWGDSANFNGYKIYVNIPYQSYIVRYHTNGQYDWSAWMNDITCTNRQLTLGSNNNIYYAGGLNDSLTIAGTHVKKPRIIGSNFIAASLDSTGALNWVRTANDSAGTAVMDYICNSVFVDTSFIVMPTAHTYIAWGSSIITNFSTRTLPVLIGYDRSGSTSWLKFTDAKLVTVHHIATNGKDVFISGNFSDTIGMALDTVTVHSAWPTTWHSPFMAKLKIPSSKIDTTNAVNVVHNTEFTVAPNPATHVLRIAGLTETTDVKMIAITGTVMYERKALEPASQEYIDVGTYPRGLYFVELKTANSRTIRKIVLQ
jgi:hypothetical protein